MEVGREGAQGEATATGAGRCMEVQVRSRNTMTLRCIIMLSILSSCLVKHDCCNTYNICISETYNRPFPSRFLLAFGFQQLRANVRSRRALMDSLQAALFHRRNALLNKAFVGLSDCGNRSVGNGGGIVDPSLSQSLLDS